MPIIPYYPLRLPPYDAAGDDIVWTGRPLKYSDLESTPIVGLDPLMFFDANPDDPNIIAFHAKWASANGILKAVPKMVAVTGIPPSDAVTSLKNDLGPILVENKIRAAVTGAMPYGGAGNVHDDVQVDAVDNEVTLGPTTFTWTSSEYTYESVVGSKCIGRELIQFFVLRVLAPSVTSVSSFDDPDTDVNFGPIGANYSFSTAIILIDDDNNVVDFQSQMIEYPDLVDAHKNYLEEIFNNADMVRSEVHCILLRGDPEPGSVPEGEPQTVFFGFIESLYDYFIEQINTIFGGVGGNVVIYDFATDTNEVAADVAEYITTAVNTFYGLS